MHAFVAARPVRRVAAALVTGLLLVLAAPLAAGAQVTDDGHVTIEAAHPAGGTAVHYIVRVTDKKDDPGNEALVTATPLLADGEEFTPVRFSPADTDGRYEGIVEYPKAGRYTLRITTVGPNARIERPVTVSVSASTTPTTGKASGTTVGPDTSFAPANDGTGASGAKKSEGGGVPIFAILALAILIIAGVTAAIVVLRRTAPAGGPTEASADGDGDGEAEGDTDAEAEAKAEAKAESGEPAEASAETL